jgi:hypothetical protein
MWGRFKGARLALVLLAACLTAFLVYFVRAGLADAGTQSRLTNYDLQSFFLPKFVYGSKELFAGRFPLWNPYEDGGVPFFATAQPSVLYPPKILLFGVLRPVQAYWAYLAIHYAALAAGFFLFVREQGLPATAAFVGASVWTFAVPILSSNYHPNRIANLAFLPFVFLLVERVCRGGGARVLAALAAIVGVQFFAGYPGYVLDTALLVGLHALVRPLAGPSLPPGKGPLRVLPFLAVAFALGAAIAAIQLFPLFEAGVLAKRAALSDPANIKLPEVPARLAPPFLVSVPGLLVFSCIALFERRALPATAGVLACVVLGQGGWIWLSRVPGFSVMRFPYLWLHLAPFFVAWLAAIGWSTFEAQAGPARGDLARRVAVVVISVAWAALAAIVALRTLSGREPFESDFGSRLAKSVTTVPSAALGIAGALLVAALCVRSVRARLGPVAFAVAAVLLVVSHEASFPFGGVTGPVKRIHGKVGEIQKYVDSGVHVSGRALSFHDIEFGHTITDRIPSALGAEESFLPHRFRRLIETFELWPLFGHLAWDEIARSRRFLDALDVDVIAVPNWKADEFAESSGLHRVSSNDETTLFRNPTRIGHAWVVYAARGAESEDSAYDLVLGGHFDPRREVVLEDPSALRQLPYLEGVDADFPRKPGRPLAERRASAGEMEYDVELRRPGVLVVSESHHPGWKAFVDGQETPILVANYAFRGVVLPPGRHTVRFEYRPASVWLGLAVSLASILGLSLFVWRTRRALRSAA